MSERVKIIFEGSAGSGRSLLRSLVWNLLSTGCEVAEVVGSDEHELSVMVKEKRAPVEEKERLERGDQIMYIPSHAQEDSAHPDRERGFVVSDNGETVFCRYWSKLEPSLLRTKANSEATPRERLVPYKSCTQAVVEAALKMYC